MLTENDVIEAVCTYLSNRGCMIRQRRSTKEKGVDILAFEVPTGREWHIEAKGETSSDSASERFGQPFSSSQIFSHVSKALFKAASAWSSSNNGRHYAIAIAFPDTVCHRKHVQQILPALRHLNVSVLFVDSFKTVEVMA